MRSDWYNIFPRTLCSFFSHSFLSALTIKEAKKIFNVEAKNCIDAIWSKESILPCRNQTVGCEGRKCAFVRSFEREWEALQNCNLVSLHNILLHFSLYSTPPTTKQEWRFPHAEWSFRHWDYPRLKAMPNIAFASLNLANWMKLHQFRKSKKNIPLFRSTDRKEFLSS